MKPKIIIIDTSITCCWLNVHKKETCGPESDRWDQSRVEEYIETETRKGAILVLPLPVIIETGNHIAQAAQNRYECASKLVEIINDTLERKKPWAAFTDQATLWESKALKELIEHWPEHVRPDIKGNLSMGDIMIKAVADYYSKLGNYQVELLTGDNGLRSYNGVALQIPRRRRGR